ncbi:OLC1v1036373C1 [Oldenlandia corymbosa var. corymbosa]|uniref:OLC1v1036373C1 n=1 Tax=Oldenlandia corymbosa var. corymbosa TaxID=529605 RepID=A0AAV1CW96_OLDCO|nr:OLC1v1036373C1 [Oldenlandia corymbosa var. corymbosa]
MISSFELARARERILTVQPKILGGELDLSHCPLGTRWSREKKVQGITRFNLAAYRDQLAVLVESDFVWMPYMTLLGRIARVCLVGQGIWRSQTWLICGDVVAPHNPSRATLMEDVRSLSIIGQRTFDADSFGYDRLGEIAQVAERALFVNATDVVRHDLDRHVEVSAWAWGARDNHIHSATSVLPKIASLIFPSPAVHPIGLHIDLHSILDKDSAHRSPHHSSHQSPHHSSPIQQAFYRPIMSPQHQQSHFAFTQFSSPQTSQRQFGDSFIDFSGFQQSSLDGQSIHYTSNFLSGMFEGVAGQHQADDPAGGERESQGEDEAEDEAEDTDQDDQFEGQGYQRHEEQGSSQTLGTPPLAVSKGQRVTKEPDRLTYRFFRAKKPKKK